MKFYLLTALILFLKVFVYAQFSRQPFIIEGNVIGAIEQQIVRLSSSYKDSSNLMIESDFAIIENGKFTFKGMISYPHAFHIWYEDSIKYASSDIFFIDSGIQKMNVNIDSMTDKTPIIIGSKTNEEYLAYFHPVDFQVKEAKWFEKSDEIYRKYNRRVPENELKQLSKERTQLFLERDSLLGRDAEARTGSIIPIWLMLKFIHRKGYNSLYNDIFNFVSKEYKNTAVGKYLKKKLELTSSTDVDSIFPALTLSDINMQPKLVGFGHTNRKYILIDFWFSHCGPCLAEFPNLKRIYSRYKEKGLEIVGISIDSKQNVQKWKSAITKYGLKWKQYLDLGGVEAINLSINAYPTNFLLDASGKVVAKNINVGELKQLLNKTLGQ